MNRLRNSLMLVLAGFVLLNFAAAAVRPDVEPGHPLWLAVAGFACLVVACIIMTGED